MHLSWIELEQLSLPYGERGAGLVLTSPPSRCCDAMPAPICTGLEEGFTVAAEGAKGRPIAARRVLFEGPDPFLTVVR